MASVAHERQKVKPNMMLKIAVSMAASVELAPLSIVFVFGPLLYEIWVEDHERFRFVCSLAVALAEMKESEANATYYGEEYQTSKAFSKYK